MKKLNSILKIIGKYKVVQNFIYWTKQPYILNNSKFTIEPIKLILLLTPLMGALYQWLFFSHFNIDYLFASDLSDPFIGLYRIGLPLLYIILLMLLLLGGVFSMFFKEYIFNKGKILSNGIILSMLLCITILECITFYIYFKVRVESDYLFLLLIIIGIFSLAKISFYKGWKDIGLLFYIGAIFLG